MLICYILFCINQFRFNLPLNLICGSWGSNFYLSVCIYLSPMQSPSVSNLAMELACPRTACGQYQCTRRACWRQRTIVAALRPQRRGAGLQNRAMGRKSEGRRGERWEVRGIALEASRAHPTLRGTLKMTYYMVLNVTMRNTVLSYSKHPKQYEPMTWQSWLTELLDSECIRCPNQQQHIRTLLAPDRLNRTDYVLLRSNQK